MIFRLPANIDSSIEPAWRPIVRCLGDVPGLVALAEAAAEKVMKIYAGGRVTSHAKADGTLVSSADLASAAIIERELKKTGIPVVCEESALPNLSDEPLFWLVDPLDGTKEFLARSGEFCINIALISHRSPVVGVVAIPATSEFFVGIEHEGAWCFRGGMLARVANYRNASCFVAMMSRSVDCRETDELLESVGVVETKRCGSAIKFCRLAEGKADIYLRLGQTMEWDTAAGQVLVEEAGCRLISLQNHERLEYGKIKFVNPDFLVLRRDIPCPVDFGRFSRVGNLG